MFGYIVPQICELKVREYEVFRAYYCGLCKALKKKYKRSAVLNYDSVFLYLLSDSLCIEETHAQPCKCGLHPMQGRTRIDAKAVSYAADINVLMAYFKAKDDVRDHKKGAVWLRRYMKRPFCKAATRQKLIEKTAISTIGALTELENQQSPNTDAAADTYGRLLGTVFENADILQSHILYDLGYSLGRWVYLIDALEDAPEDQKSGNYNVYVCKYGTVDAAVRKTIEKSLVYSLAQAAQALDRLEIRRNKGLLQNIIYLGLRRQTELVAAGLPRMAEMIK